MGEAPKDTGEERSYDEKLAEQKQKDALREQDSIRKWVEEDVPPPVKTSCKSSKHIVSKK